MNKPTSLTGPSGFFNPTPGSPETPVHVVLEQVVQGDRERFRLRKRIGYWDAEVGGIIVPDDLNGFESDLTSVPKLFAWLVGKTGPHLPAALIHDGLVDHHHYLSDVEVDRDTADRVFRSALRDLGTPRLRQWLMWTAVTAATMWTARPKPRWLARAAVVLTVLTVMVFGTLATIDIFDCRNLVPWMGARPAWQEAVTGGIAALVIPSVVARLFWGSRWRAGIIAGAALALLLHVTVAVVIVSGVYVAAEAAFERRWGRAAIAAGVALAVGGLVLAIGVWAC
jgi:hypothetical protein